MACCVSGASSAHHHQTMMLHHQQQDFMMTPEPQLDDYDWIGDLGEGGFARVSKVRHRRTAEVFALKEAFFPSPYAAEEAEVLRRAAWFPSPYVVQCHAVLLEPDGGLSSVLEFMDAGSLFSVLCRRGRGFPEPVLAEVTFRCLMGLAQLHTRGVAHLDVKPENFLCNTVGEIKISDFNASRILNGRAGKKLMVPTDMGTAAYSSPERFEPHAHADPHGAMAADVWGLGLTVLELFTRRQLIVPETEEGEEPKPEDWKRAVCDREPPSVPKDMDGSPELRDFVSVCLRKDPTRRARVPHLLRHPFVTGRDASAASRALRDLIVERSRNAWM